MSQGLRSAYGVGAPPFTKGPYTWDQRVNFSAGIGGTVVHQFNGADVWYVDKTNNAVAGDGKSWENAFTTITAAIAVAGNYDTIFVGPGFYTEAAALTITQTGLKIYGCNSSGKTRGPCSMKTPTAAGSMLTIAVNSNDVEIAGISFIATSGQKAIEIGDAATGYVWRTHIHDCGFFGDDTGTYAIGVYGATTTPAAGAFPDCAECVVENCYFYAWATACTCCYGTRVLIQNNTMFIPTTGNGIIIGCGRPFQLVAHNNICGVGGTETGMVITGNDDGSVMLVLNAIACCNTPFTKTISDAGNIWTMGYADGTAVVQHDPT